jgi:ABC-type nitrate/sulfonate/bicarbonate transport system substrate-binding protein
VIVPNDVSRRTFLLSLLAASGAALAACGSASTASAPSAGSAAASSPPAVSRAGAGSPAGPASVTKLRVAYGPANMLNMPIWLAYEQGFFKKHGFDVEMTQIEGATISQALVGGSVDMIGSTASSTTLANLQGGDTLLVGSNLNVVPNDIVVDPKKIQKPEDLRGKTAAVSKGGDFSQTAIIIALTSLGMGMNDVKYLVGSTSDPLKLQSMIGGAADFASMDAGFRNEYTKAGMQRLFSLLDRNAHFVMAGVYTSKAFAGRQPAAVEDYLKAMTESLYFFHNDKPGTLKIGVKYMKLPMDSVETAYDLFKPHMQKLPEFTVDDVKQSLTVLEAANPKAKTANPEDFYTTIYLDKVRSSGFFKQVWGADQPA